MISMTDRAKKKLNSLLKGENRAGLRIVSGPDQRLRLVLDKGIRIDEKRNRVTGYLIQDETNTLMGDIMIDVLGQELVFKRLAKDNSESKLV
jgi:hypothetical protein